MGLSQSSDFEATFNTTYNFINMEHDQNYGLIKIYRKKEVNFDYIMIYDEVLFAIPSLEKKMKLNFVQSLRKNPHDRILRVYHYKFIEGSTIECKPEILRYYVDYCNLSLLHLLRYNINNKIYLTYDEIVFIIDCVVQVYKVFQSYNLFWFTINPSEIFLATNGYLYFSPFPIKKNQSKDTFCGMIPAEDSNLSLRVSIAKYDKTLKNQLKRLLLLLTSYYPKERLQEYRQLFVMIQSQDTIQNLSLRLPKPKINKLNLEKQIFRFGQSSSESSEISVPVLTRKSQKSSQRLFTEK